MIDSKFPVEIAGKRYTLAEDSEGAHYQRIREPLRAPTNGMVLGDTGKFNLRPDLLEWNMTDWSGGEGASIFSTDTADKYSLGYNIDGLSVRGALKLSMAATPIGIKSTEAALTGSRIAAARQDIFLVDHDATPNIQVRKYNSATNEWDINDTGPSAGLNDLGVYGTGSYLFVGNSSGGDDIIRWDGTNFVTFDNNSVDSILGSVGGYLYGFLPSVAGSIVIQFDLAATAPVTGTPIFTVKDVLFSFDSEGADRLSGVSVLNGLYLVGITDIDETTLWKVTPTIASAPAFGNEITRIKGFRGTQAISLNGVLFIIGLSNNIPTVYYYDPVQESFGVQFFQPLRTVAHASAPSNTIFEGGGKDATISNVAYFAQMGGNNFTNGREWTVWAIDSITGGLHAQTVIDASTTFSGATKVGRAFVVSFKGDLFVCLTSRSADAAKTYKLTPGIYTTNTGILDSAVNDFGIADDKVLTSFRLLTDPLASDCSVVVKYQLNQDGVWLTAGTMNTDNATRADFVVSTNSTTKTFRNLQVRLELSNGGTTSQTPVVRSCRVRATVVKGVRIWKLILNASDELGQMQNRTWSGETLITNITAAADSDSVVLFKDGYGSRAAGTTGYIEYDVVIDDYTVVNDRPGEGIINVSLREVG